jgi:UDP-3-O-[3-hydroxymyristoyl] N-acetylglucosamine deacetylase
MRFRRTIARNVEIAGIGLHTGANVKVRLEPAPAESGIVFVRTDAGDLEIPATLEHAGPSFYATVLQRGGVSVSTIEHLMAALYALGIDDARIRIDGPEVPVLDGSSRPFVDAISSAGIVETSVPRLYITVVRPITVSMEEKEKSISVHPCREYRVTYAIEFPHPELGYQELTASLWRPDEFAVKLAPARTFTFEREVDALRRAGLARGGSLENAVVFGEHGLLNPEGFRFPDEPVRHKMLDLTGDLALLGRPLRGHVVAYRAGHDMHSLLARRILESRDCWHLAPWTEGAAETEETPSGMLRT